VPRTTDFKHVLTSVARSSWDSPPEASWSYELTPEAAAGFHDMDHTRIALPGPPVFVANETRWSLSL
jgi:hypothetical protein